MLGWLVLGAVRVRDLPAPRHNYLSGAQGIHPGGQPLDHVRVGAAHLVPLLRVTVDVEEQRPQTGRTPRAAFSRLANHGVLDVAPLCGGLVGVAGAAGGVGASLTTFRLRGGCNSSHNEVVVGAASLGLGRALGRSLALPPQARVHAPPSRQAPPILQELPPLRVPNSGVVVNLMLGGVVMLPVEHLTPHCSGVGEQGVHLAHPVQGQGGAVGTGEGAEGGEPVGPVHQLGGGPAAEAGVQEACAGTCPGHRRAPRAALPDRVLPAPQREIVRPGVIPPWGGGDGSAVVGGEHHNTVIQHVLGAEGLGHVANALVHAAEHAGEGAALGVFNGGVVGIPVGGRHLRRGVHGLVGQIQEEGLGHVVLLHNIHRPLGEDVGAVLPLPLCGHL
mmetsp:Transcript_60046/g.129580  ORF Transcript_60046/g.129580 Transcript_60046/m.129580 type:complete len:389 (-) Transcript_60046:553-1719(-)